MVDMFYDFREGGAAISASFEGQPHADHFEGVGEKYGCDACEGAADQAAEWGFLIFSAYDNCADLFVGNEFDGCVGKYAEKSCRVAAIKAEDSFIAVDIFHGCDRAEP